jgi:hypothetical protein
LASGTIAEKMRIDSSGNVGIGTTAPQQRLGVKGASNVPQLYLMQDNVANDGWKQFADSSSGSLNFLRTTAGVDTEYMRIGFTGDLLVGTTSSFSGGNVLGVMAQASGLPSLGLNRTTSTGPIARFYYASSEIGNISTNGSNCTFNSTSDYRLKEDILPMTGALAKVTALKPVVYKWKLTGIQDEGFIAHELAEVCPSAVTGEKDAVDADGNPKYQGIDTSFLVATLTAAIQELKALTDTQASTITSLTARITALETPEPTEPTGTQV